MARPRESHQPQTRTLKGPPAKHPYPDPESGPALSQNLGCTYRTTAPPKLALVWLGWLSDVWGWGILFGGLDPADRAGLVGRVAEFRGGDRRTLWG